MQDFFLYWSIFGTFIHVKHTYSSSSLPLYALFRCVTALLLFPPHTHTHHFPEYIIGNVPLVWTDAVGGGVAEDDRSFRHVQHLVHHCHSHMSQVDQHPQTVHLHDQLLLQEGTMIISVINLNALQFKSYKNR